MPIKDGKATEVTIKINPEDINLSEITGCEGLFEDDEPTLEELDEELDELHRNFRELAEKREAVKVKHEQDEAAKQMFGLYQSFIDGGFTEVQAWKIFITFLKRELGA